MSTRGACEVEHAVPIRIRIFALWAHAWHWVSVGCVLVRSIVEVVHVDNFALYGAFLVLPRKEGAVTVVWPAMTTAAAWHAGVAEELVLNLESRSGGGGGHHHRQSSESEPHPFLVHCSGAGSVVERGESVIPMREEL